MIGIRRLLLLLALLGPSAAAANDYLSDLVAVARERKLADHPQWHALLHYKSRLLFPGVKSQADDAGFFNASNGKVDPQQELEATLAAFFSALPETPSQQNPQCRFIARYHWLKQELRFDPRRLPEQPCLRYDEWRRTLNPEALTLVFPAAYLNNPASLYGHTLLRVDGKDQDERTRLLAYAINYAAATNETSGLAFAINGIFGGYPGLFSISPYYAKVAEYNDLENRDIWEYELNFTLEEIDLLLMHAWELGPTHFDYYFFDENCSYYLLSLFDVARPTLGFTERFSAWVIPADTVRIVVEESGLLRRVTYRPARSTILRFRQQQLPRAHIEIARDIALRPSAIDNDALAHLSDAERARVLELAYEYLEYQRLRGQTQDAGNTAARLRELLLMRSRLPATNDPAPPMPTVRPDEGHPSGRVTLRLGRDSGHGFQELHWRAAYHDLLDPEEGFNRGAAIEFLGVALRRREQDEKTRVQSIDFINITSLSPRDDLLKPMSWTVNLGYKRKRLGAENEPLVFRVLAGAGYTREVASSFLTYGMLTGALDKSDHLDHDYAIGAGPAAGMLFDASDRWRIQLEGRALKYGIGDAHTANELRLNQRYTIGRQNAVHLDLSRRREFSEISQELAVAWSYYF